MRFRGEEEPIDPVAGHIPGACNAPWEDLLEDGRFRSPQALVAQLSAALDGVPAHDAVVYCGSGVTACADILAMELAGLGTPALYVGSWSEWCRSQPPSRHARSGQPSP